MQLLGPKRKRGHPKKQPDTEDEEEEITENEEEEITEDDRPGKYWFYGFMQCNPQLTE